MITKITKRHLIGLSFIICHLSFSVALTSCSDWNDHYESGEGSEGGATTLWEQMKANAQLSDFCEVLEQTKVFRMHKKTSVSYADLLNSGQSFTVVAPVNGKFDKQALLNQVQTHKGDSVVEKTFVLNHISRNLTPVTSSIRRMLMLNSKYAKVENGKISGVSMISTNLHARNGVLHVASDQLPYMPNLYELLCDDPQLSVIGECLRIYDEDYFDADASVSSGIVEGVPVYIDSVVIERNRLLERIGYINDEDSTYWMVVPTATGWQKAWDQAKEYFKYDETVQKRDSIQRYYLTRALLDDAIFNETDQRSPQDSVVSVPYMYNLGLTPVGKPVYHVFQKPFEPKGIFYNAQKKECSNGIVYQTNEWPFTPEQAYLHPLWIEGEYAASLLIDEKDCTYNIRQENSDSISEHAFLQIVPEKNTSNWALTFRINNFLSGNYDIYAVILPRHDDVDNGSKPCKFKAAINYVDEKGEAKTFDCGNQQFETDPNKKDSVLLAENFHFPTCNYGQPDIKASVKIFLALASRESRNYSRQMYLDCIYLKPRRD